MVKGIVGFKSKLDVTSRILSQHNFLEYRHVPLVEARPANRVYARIHAKAPLRRGSETRGVDERGERSLAARQVRIARKNDARRNVIAAGDPAISFVVGNIG